jgi:hypothetical protein
MSLDNQNMSLDNQNILQDGRVVHTPLSIRQALRLGTMTNVEARAYLAAWGESESDIQSALNSGGWS